MLPCELKFIAKEIKIPCLISVIAFQAASWRFVLPVSFPVDLLLWQYKSTGKETGKMHLCGPYRVFRKIAYDSPHNLFSVFSFTSVSCQFSEFGENFFVKYQCSVPKLSHLTFFLGGIIEVKQPNHYRVLRKIAQPATYLKARFQFIPTTQREKYRLVLNTILTNK